MIAACSNTCTVPEGHIYCTISSTILSNDMQRRLGGVGDYINLGRAPSLSPLISDPVVWVDLPLALALP